MRISALILLLAACGGPPCDYCPGANTSPQMALDLEVVVCECPTRSERSMGFLVADTPSCGVSQEHWRSYVAAGCEAP